MPLTDSAIRTAKPKDKAYKLFDGGGMYLEISPSGGKWWRLKYRIDGKEQRISLGVYPDVTLKSARERREEVRKLLANGINPSVHRKAAKANHLAEQANTFEAVAREWHSKQKTHWTERHAGRVMDRLVKDLFPFLGHHPIRAISAAKLLTALQQKERNGAVYSAKRLRQISDQVFRYAIATGKAERNPAPDLRGALLAPAKTHLAAMTDPKQVGGLMRSIDSYKGNIVTKCALRLAPLVFVRPGELRQAEWSEIDFEVAEWNIPAAKMKMREAHLVPLSKQAVAILQELHPYTGRGRYVFPSMRTSTRPMSDNAVLSALRRMGFGKEEMSGHGFRAMARTILDEVLQVRPDYIEHQLAHAVRDPNGRAYNRTSHLEERRKMMQLWADYLDGLKTGAHIIPLNLAAK